LTTKYFPDLGPDGGYPYDSSVHEPLDDGTYEVIVLDVDDSAAEAHNVSVTILTGPHKGAVISLRATGFDGDPLELLAAPGVLTVTDGTPHLRLDD
jgi:hypothetical protein